MNALYVLILGGGVEGGEGRKDTVHKSRLRPNIKIVIWMYTLQHYKYMRKL